jgi:poly-beta-1,6-N-acetyl-D-glucosamine synthase
MNSVTVWPWHVVVYALFYVVTFALVGSTFFFEPVERDFSNLSLLINVVFLLACLQVLRYVTYMMMGPWHNVRVRATKPRTTPYCPKVSVIIPAWNEEVGILGTIESLLKSTYRNLEIVVINDGSTDDSDALISAYVEQFKAIKGGDPAQIVYRYKQNGGKGSALNLGISLASGDIIMTVDADCIVDSNAVAEAVMCFEDPKVMAAVANVKIGNRNSLLAAAQHIEFTLSFYFKKVDAMLDAVYIIGGAGGIFRKEVFTAIGGFNEKNITEDIDLSMRIQRMGMKIAYADRALVYTEGAGDIVGLMKQRLRWKRGRIETFIQHKVLFFSTSKKHRVVLSWFILPVALLGDIQLFFEPIFLMALYFIGLHTHNFAPFVSSMMMLTFMLSILFIFEKERDAHTLLLAPIAWMLFYVTTFVELSALVRSLWGMARKRELKWQRWQRQGLAV